jgi:hypothetical protein
MAREFEYAYVKSVLGSLVRSRIKIIPYIPSARKPPPRSVEVYSAWKGIEEIIPDLIERFDLGTERCLEFGVERGFSTVALSSYFKSVTGVDTFMGDKHTNVFDDFLEATSARVAPYDNIALIRADYRDFIKTADPSFNYDLVHVDIIHTFADTYACGLWSAQHSKCTIFHDTESFPAVKQAVREIARKTGKKFYNFEECYGLGIVV